MELVIIVTLDILTKSEKIFSLKALSLELKHLNTSYEELAEMGIKKKIHNNSTHFINDY